MYINMNIYKSRICVGVLEFELEYQKLNLANFNDYGGSNSTPLYGSL